MMKKSFRLLSTVLALVLILGLAAGCTPTTVEPKGNDKTPDQSTNQGSTDKPQKVLELDMWMHESGFFRGNPQEDIVQEAIAKITGVKITDVITSGELGDYQRFNMLYASDELPALLNMQVSDELPKMLSQLIEKDMAYAFTDEELEKYVPDIKKLIPPLAWELHKDENGLSRLILEGAMSAGAEMEKRYPDWVNNDVNLSARGRNLLYMRDDALTRIFPNAKTQKELEEILAQKGELTWDDIHIPELDTVEGFFDYLYKVKELYGDEIIPLCYMNVAHLGGQFIPSMLGMPAYPFFDPISFEVTGIAHDDKNLFLDRFAKLNQMYKDGLIDKDFAIQKQDQYNEKFANGKYAATFSNKTTNAVNAPLEQINAPFRYRKVPVNYANGEKNMMIDGYGLAETSRVRAGWLLNKKKIKEEDVPAILNYLNYFATDEGLKMTVWGPEDSGLWEEVNGKRQWKSQEFKNVITGATPVGTTKDFAYYGIHAMDPKYLRDSYYRINWHSKNPYLATVEEKPNVSDEINRLAHKEHIKGFIDYSFFAWNTAHPSNNIFWAEWTALNDLLAKAIMSQNESQYNKTMEEYYDVYYNKAKFLEVVDVQYREYIEYLKVYKDYHRFHPDADLSKLN